MVAPSCCEKTPRQCPVCRQCTCSPLYDMVLPTTSIRAKETELQSVKQRGSQEKLLLSLRRVRRMAVSMSVGKAASYASIRWQWSRIQSAFPTPSLPSYTPKNEICFPFWLVLVKLVTIQILSQLQLKTGPQCEFAEYARTDPYAFDDTFAFSITQGTPTPTYCSSLTSRSCSLKDTWRVQAVGGWSFGLRRANPDCDRWCSFSNIWAVALNGFSRSMARLSMSTLVRATTALLRIMELFREGRFFSVLRVDKALPFQFLSIDILMDSQEDIYSHPFPKEQLPAIALYFQKALRDPPPVYNRQEILSQPLVCSTITKDVRRTRSALMSPQQHLEMEHMLNHFCRVRQLQYKQGLNEIIAPFVYLTEAAIPLERTYALFSAFFDAYCLNFYYDKDFNSMEIIFRMVGMVIKYHSPGLARYLEIYEIEPQIICLGWLMTLFGSKLSLKLCYTLWMFLATDRDPFLTFFLIIAIILMRKDEIIKSKDQSIFAVVTALLFKDDRELANALKVALVLRKNTPASLTIFFRDRQILQEKHSFQELRGLLKQLQKLNLFFVSSEEVSLRQHFRPGLCQRHCYFCHLRQAPRLPISHEKLRETMPLLNNLIQMDGDIRQMDYSIDFVVLDLRADKGRELPYIEGITVYQINLNNTIEREVEKINERFLQIRDREHFLFLLNEFSFQKEIQSPDRAYCLSLIQVLNSFSFPHLSMLEGGERAYFNFMSDLQIKSEIIDSRLIPVSECDPSPQFETTADQERQVLSISEIVTISQLYDHSKLNWFEGIGANKGHLLFIVQGGIALIESNQQISKLLRFLKQHKSIMEYLVEEQEALAVPCRLIRFYSLNHMTKMAVRLHHNNCIIFYLYPHDPLPRRKLWKLSLAELVQQQEEPAVERKLKRIGFESESLEEVKEISKLIKENYKRMLLLKKGHIAEMERKDQMNYNIIEDQLCN